MRLFNGLAFRSLLHPRVPRNLRARPPRALRSVGLDSGTLWTAYSRVTSWSCCRRATVRESLIPPMSHPLVRSYRSCGSDQRLQSTLYTVKSLMLKYISGSYRPWVVRL